MAPVELYIYDLSNGIAKNLSYQLTGRQFDGIWHTSVVAFGKEVYYGPYNPGPVPGIQIVEPGRSHHGRPMLVENMGDTQIDEETFWEYIQELQSVYTGDKYHLIEFNCNGFSNDCVGFLTGGSIPSYIKELPTDFFATPFGQQLRPMIDQIFRRTLPAPSSTPRAFLPAPTLATTSGAEAAILTSPIHICTNSASFNSLLRSNKAVVAFFTSDTCAPCKMISPVFGKVATEKNRDGAAFIEVNMSNGMSGVVAQDHGISATPTFLFFLSGSKTDELRGVNAIELRSKVDLLLYEAFPLHPHVKLDLPAIRAVSLKPIIYSQPPSFDAAYGKLASFIEASSAPDKSAVVTAFKAEILPFLKVRFPPATANGKEKAQPNTSVPQSFLASFAKVTITLLNNLQPAELFPVVDFWRVAVLDDRVASWLGLAGTRKDGPQTDITQKIFVKVVALHEEAHAVPRNLLLTTLRLASNCFMSSDLTRHILTPSTTSSASVAPRSTLTSVLIPALLHDDDSTRTAAASLAFNIAQDVQKPLMEAGGKTPESTNSDMDAEWQVEIVSALVEALSRESSNEAIVHRLTASLALMLHLSPFYAESVAPLLEVLQTREMMLAKLAPVSVDGKGALAFGRELQKLIREVASLCPPS
ncbi:hypothetical protein FRB96_001481 [Tulasnella sp. 330]|nr:hypothetical protein FRB96_001481 [Tulasnella sp. 330]